MLLLCLSGVCILVAGPNFTYSTGSIPQLSVTDLVMVKEVSMCTSLNLGLQATVRARHSIFKWPNLVKPEEDYCS